MENTLDNLDLKNFVNYLPRRKRGNGGKSKGLRKAKRAKGVIESHITNGIVYYYYRRGTAPPIYLGSAEKILKQCKLAT